MVAAAVAAVVLDLQPDTLARVVAVVVDGLALPTQRAVSGALWVGLPEGRQVLPGLLLIRAVAAEAALSVTAKMEISQPAAPGGLVVDGVQAVRAGLLPIGRGVAAAVQAQRYLVTATLRGCQQEHV